MSLDTVEVLYGNDKIMTLPKSYLAINNITKQVKSSMEERRVNIADMGEISLQELYDRVFVRIISDTEFRESIKIDVNSWDFNKLNQVMMNFNLGREDAGKAIAIHEIYTSMKNIYPMTKCVCKSPYYLSHFLSDHKIFRENVMRMSKDICNKNMKIKNNLKRDGSVKLNNKGTLLWAGDNIKLYCPTHKFMELPILVNGDMTTFIEWNYESNDGLKKCMRINVSVI